MASKTKSVKVSLGVQNGGVVKNKRVRAPRANKNVLSAKHQDEKVEENVASISGDEKRTEQTSLDGFYSRDSSCVDVNSLCQSVVESGLRRINFFTEIQVEKMRMFVDQRKGYPSQVVSGYFTLIRDAFFTKQRDFFERFPEKIPVIGVNVLLDDILWFSKENTKTFSRVYLWKKNCSLSVSLIESLFGVVKSRSQAFFMRNVLAGLDKELGTFLCERSGVNFKIYLPYFAERRCWDYFTELGKSESLPEKVEVKSKPVDFEDYLLSFASQPNAFEVIGVEGEREVSFFDRLRDESKSLDDQEEIEMFRGLSPAPEGFGEELL